MAKKNPRPRAIAAPMDTPRPIRKFWMSPELHAAAMAYASDNRTTISELIRAQLVDITRDPLDDSVMTAADETQVTANVSAAVDDELYFAAKDAAYPTRKSMTSLVRRRLLFILEREGALPARETALV